MKLVLEFIGWLLVVFSLLPLIRTTRWWIRVLDFPRFQVFVVLSALLVIYLLKFKPDSAYGFVFAGAVGLTLLLQGWSIIPFTVLGRKPARRSTQTDERNRIKLLVSNVRMNNFETATFLEIIRHHEPDLILINEPNAWWAEQLRELDERYPYAIKKPLENTYGMMLYSRLPIRKSEIKHRVQEGIPSICAEVELPSGQLIAFFGVHPQPPHFQSDTDVREAELLLVAREVQNTNLPCVVAGDLNDVGWSHTTRLFGRLSGLLDPRLGRGFFNTYSVFTPGFRYPLDHVFYSPSLALVDLRRLPKFGSDHFPILITLSYEPEKEAVQATPAADHEDHREAQELIKEGVAEGASKGPVTEG